MDTVLVVSTVGGKWFDRATHLIKQISYLESIVNIVGGQHRRCNLLGVSVHDEVQFAPRQPCLRAMLRAAIRLIDSFKVMLSTKK